MRTELIAGLLAVLLLGCTEDPVGEPPGDDDTAGDDDACVPDVDGLLQGWELAEEVEVVYDDMGVPHIYAQNDLDLFWAAGYLVAQDRLFQMDILRRASVGTLAEVIGEAGLESDYQARTLDFDRYSCEILAMHVEEGVDEVNASAAYMSGLNHRVDEVLAGEADLPAGYTTLDFEPTPFDRDDLVALGMRLNFAFSNTLFPDLFYAAFDALAPAAGDPTVPVFRPATEEFVMVDAPPAGPPPAPPAGAALVATDDEEAWLELLDVGGRFQHRWGFNRGSNNWAIAGEHTADGRPIIAGDPHSYLADPSYLYLQHLNSADAGGSYDAVGFSFAGTPGIHLGHNRDLVWTATTNFADAVDVWDVQVDGDDVLIGDQWVTMTERTETILIRQEDGSVRSEPFVVRTVGEYGTLVPQEMLPLPMELFANGSLLLNWTGFTPTSGLMLYLHTNRAETLADFEAATEYQKSGIQNWVGATAEDILFTTHGLVPDRGETTPPAYQVLDGSDPSTFWDGWLGDDIMPRLDGSDGYLFTANNDPWGHTADNDPLNDDFYYGSWFAPGFRAGRIREEVEALVAAGDVTAEQVMAVQTDVTSDAAVRLLPLLDEAVAAIPTDPELAEYVDRTDITDASTRLGGWDRTMTMGDHEPALFRAWFTTLIRSTASDDLGLLFDAVDELQPIILEKVTVLAHEDQIESVLDGSRDMVMLTALDDALTYLAARAADLGADEVTWGDLHVASFDRDYVTYYDFEYGDDTKIAWAGDATSINVAECRFWDGSDLANQCVGEHGPIFRAVARFDADGVPEYWYSWPFGHDGDATSWVEGSYTHLPFLREDVDARAADTVILAPN